MWCDLEQPGHNMGGHIKRMEKQWDHHKEQYGHMGENITLIPEEWSY